MKNRMRNSRNSGFTLTEALVVVGISIILLGVAIVSVARYMDVLKITELDNAAREIYMAAENRAVLLSNAHRLDDLVEEAGIAKQHSVDLSGYALHASGEDLYYVTRTTYSKELLTDGSIDPALLERGDFYIVYDLSSGSVTDVFYTEKTKDVSRPLEALVVENVDFKTFYSHWANDRSTRLSLKNGSKDDGEIAGASNDRGTLVGWYNSEAAQGGKFGPNVTEKPKLEVMIDNKEKLTVTVTVRGEYIKELASGWSNLTVRLGPADLTEDDFESFFKCSDLPLAAATYVSSADSLSWTWLLDSLDQDTNGNYTQQFKNRTYTVHVTPGDDFKVMARLVTDDGPVYAEDTDNSLFQRGSGGDRAYVRYLRHLQNLSAANGFDSGVNSVAGKKKTSAVQTSHIQVYNNDTYNKYLFIPVSNIQLTDYNGDGFEIRNLIVDLNSSPSSYPAAMDKTSLGLFGAVPVDMTFQNIRLVNTTLIASNATGNPTLVGALTGKAGGTVTIDHCWVYWDEERLPEGQGLQAVLGSDRDETNSGKVNYHYQLVGDTVGGLVGVLDGTAKITNSLAATLINAAEYAGGLVGQLNTGTIDNSYADCYLTGNNHVAGMIGDLADTSNPIDVTLTNCYATGYILSEDENAGTWAKEVAGLCMGEGFTKTVNVYAAMRYPGWSVTGWIKPTDRGNIYRYFLMPGTQSNDDKGNNIYISNGSFTNTYFLGPGAELVLSKDQNNSIVSSIQGSAFGELTDRKGTTDPAANSSRHFAARLGSAFNWKYSGDGRSHPYNLRQYLHLTVYEFPGLKDTAGKDIPHYGDWGSEFKEPSLVYYEEYRSDEYAGIGKIVQDEDGKYISWGVSGGNARGLLSSLKDDQVIPKDGYGVAFLEDDILKEDGTYKVTTVKIRYTYYDSAWNLKTWPEGGGFQSYDVNKLPTSEVNLDVSQVDDEDDGQNNGQSGSQDKKDTVTLFLIPMDDSLIKNAYADPNFFQYLRFELYLGISENPDDLNEGVFFYNPHFAETVEPYIAEGQDSSKWDRARVESTAGSLARDLISVSVRTPRHLYDLSEYEEYYNNSRKDTFRQNLDLDYSTYTGYGYFTTAQNAKKPYDQNPIGSESLPFVGTYNGGSHIIKNVLPKVDLSQANRYVGLFGYSTGTLRNAVYELNPEHPLATEAEKIAGGLYMGALSGYSIGLIDNCAVYGAALNARVSSVDLYVGGLIGLNNGMLQNSAAECAGLDAAGYSTAQLYIGGLAGQNGGNGTINTSYAVGRISVDANNGPSADICGFAGSNLGTINNCYAAVDLKLEGDGVTAYGFSKDEGARNNVYFLDQGSFSYRDVNYAIDYKTENESLTYAQLTGELTDETTMNREKPTPLPVSGMEWATNTPVKEKDWVEKELRYPYPTAVTNAKGEYVHYGRWPGAMPMGDFGVLYWEKLRTGAGTDADPYIYTYHVDALTVDVSGKTISRQSTLSTAHNDGSVVVAYGYGYYYDSDSSAPTFTANGLGYFEYVPDILTTPDTTANDWSKRTAPTSGTFNGSTMPESSTGKYTGGEQTYDRTAYVKSIDGGALSNNGTAVSGYNKTTESSAKLQEIIPGNFTVVSWDSYHEGGRPTTWSGTEDYDKNRHNTTALNSYLASYTSDRKKQSTAGLVPDYQKGWDPNPDNNKLGTFKLVRGDATVEFVVDPHFAGALSVKAVDNDANKAKTWAGELTAVPGSKSNPFQVRSGAQLQEINASTSFYTDFCIGMGGPLATYEKKYWDFPTAARFPYLSSVNFETTGTNYSKLGSIGTLIEKPGTTGAQHTGSNWDQYYRYYYFKQTHDIDWTEEGNIYYTCDTCTVVENGEKVAEKFTCADAEAHRQQTGHTLTAQPGVFTPIAAAAGRMAQDVWHLVDMPGWFAGTYNGDDYTIKNLNIDINSEDYNTSCIGLFGAIYNNKASYATTETKYSRLDTTTLTHIVLYNETGEGGTVTVRGRAAGSSREPGGGTMTCAVRWYSGGVLVGAALGGCDINNCAVAGYTIIDQTITAADNATYQHSTSGFNQTNDAFHHYGPSGTEVSYSTTATAANIRNRKIRTSSTDPNQVQDADIGHSSLVNTTSEIIAGAVGGLVGLTDGNLTGCSAVTTIIMRPNHIEFNKAGYYSELPNGVQDLLPEETNLIFVFCGEGSPVRAGGLVGSTIGDVKNCYTGGEIQVDFGITSKTGKPATTHCTLRIGRVVGGVGAGVFKAKGATTVNISNCYSYMEMPDGNFRYQNNEDGWFVIGTEGNYTTADKFTFSSSNIAGKGPGGLSADSNAGNVTLNVDKNTCFYLENTGDGKNIVDEAWRPTVKNSSGKDVADTSQYQNGALATDGTPISYLTLAGADKRTVNIYTALGSAFKPVTSKLGEDGNGLTITGRFTFVPEKFWNDETKAYEYYDYLQNLDYPFPAALTQTRPDVAGGKASVHYGAWDYRGIKRDSGGAPVRLDMFAREMDPVTGEYKGNPGEYTETLSLVGKGVAYSWKWYVECDDGDVFVDINGNTTTGTAELIIKPQPGKIETPKAVTVTVKYYEGVDANAAAIPPNAVAYELKIPVYITANVELKPSTAEIYPFDEVVVPLTPDIPGIKDGEFELAITDVECIGGLLDAELTETEDGAAAIKLTRYGQNSSGPIWVDVTYNYTQIYEKDADGNPTVTHTIKDKTHRINVYLKSFPTDQWWDQSNGSLTWTIDFTGHEPLPDGDIIESKIPNIDELGLKVENFELRRSGSQFIMTLLLDELKVSQSIKLNIKVLMSDGLVHTLTLTAPKPATPGDFTLDAKWSEKDDSWIYTLSGPYALNSTGTNDDVHFVFDGNNNSATFTTTQQTITLRLYLNNGISLTQWLDLTIDLIEPEEPDKEGQPVVPVDGSWTVEIGGWKFEDVKVMDEGSPFKADAIDGKCVITLVSADENGQTGSDDPADENGQADEDDVVEVTLNAALSRQSDNGLKQNWPLTFTVELKKPEDAGSEGGGGEGNGESGSGEINDPGEPGDDETVPGEPDETEGVNAGGTGGDGPEDEPVAAAPAESEGTDSDDPEPEPEPEPAASKPEIVGMGGVGGSWTPGGKTPDGKTPELERTEGSEKPNTTPTKARSQTVLSRIRLKYRENPGTEGPAIVPVKARTALSRIRLKYRM